MSDTAVSKSYAFSIAATAVLITVSANWASARVSGGSSPVVRRKKTPSWRSFIENGSATAERVGTLMPSRSQRRRSFEYNGSVRTSVTSTSRPEEIACSISGYRASSISRLRSIGFS